MPRDAAGNYTLPAGNPVIAGTIITATWANPTMADLGAEITNSLSRNGQGGMLAPLFFFDGNSNAPSIAFTNEPTLGLYRPSQGVIGFTGGGDLTFAIDTDTGDVTALEGQLRTAVPAPVQDSDLTRKDYVDAAIAAIQTLIDKPIGAIEIGWNPNGVFAGTWTQWPEGTFIMNTLGGDLNGGSNDAIVVSHTHTATQPDHTHTASSPPHSHSIQGDIDNGSQSRARTADTSRPATLSTSAVAVAVTVAANSAGAITVASAGESPVNKNKPLYKGVAIWERTA
jgi:hypothetical protein